MKVNQGLAVIHQGTQKNLSITKAKIISVLGVATYQWDMQIGNRKIGCRAPVAFYNNEKNPKELRTTLFGLSSNFLMGNRGTATDATLTFFQSGTFQYVFRFDPGRGRELKVVTAPRLKTLRSSGSVSDCEHSYLSGLGNRLPKLFVAPERRAIVDFQFGKNKTQRTIKANVYPDLVSQGYIEISIVDEEGHLCFNYNALNYGREELERVRARKKKGLKYDLFSPQLTRQFYSRVTSLLVAGYDFRQVLGIDDFSVGAGDVVMRHPVSDSSPLDLRCITVRKLQNVSFAQYLDYIRGLRVKTFKGKELPFLPIADLSGFEFSRAVFEGLRERYSNEDAKDFYKRHAYPHLAQIFKYTIM